MEFFYFNTEKSYNYLLANAYKALKKSVDWQICMQLDSEETVWNFLEYVSKYLDKKDKNVLSKDAFKNCIKGAISTSAWTLKKRGEVEFYTEEEKKEIKAVSKRCVGLIKKVNYVKDENSYTNDEGEEVSKLDNCVDVASNERFDKINFDFLKIHLSKIFGKDEVKLFTHVFEVGWNYYDEEILWFSSTKWKRIYDELLSYLKDNKDLLFIDYRPNTTYNNSKYRENSKEQEERIRKDRENIENIQESIEFNVFIEMCIDYIQED